MVLNVKDEAPDRIVWRTPCGRGYEPVVRHTTEWMKAYGGVEVRLQALLTLALQGGEWSSYTPHSRSGRFVEKSNLPSELIQTPR